MSARIWNLIATLTFPRGLYTGPHWWRSLNHWWLGWWGWAFFYTDPWRPGRPSR